MLRTKPLLLGAHADLVAPTLVATVVAGGLAGVAIVEVASAIVVLPAEAPRVLPIAVLIARVIVGFDVELAAIRKARS